MGYRWTLLRVTNETSLHHIDHSRISTVWERDRDGGISDGVPFVKFVFDVFKWCPAIDHQIEDASEGPDITWSANLAGNGERGIVCS